MIRRRYIDNPDGGQIHLAEAGTPSAEKPSLLLLHQTPRSWDEYREVMLALGPDYHLIAMDLPGMGASSPAGSPASIEVYANAAAHLMAQYGQAPMIVCGHHTGGVVAIELAANHSDKVASLILSSTPWLDPAIRLERSRKTPIDTITPEEGGRHLIDLWEQRAPYYPKDPVYLNRLIMDALKTHDMAEGHHAVGQYRMDLAVPKIKCPVQLIEHSKDPFAVKYTPFLMSAFPQARVDRIKNGYVPLEVTAAEFAAIVRKWVTSSAGAM